MELNKNITYPFYGGMSKSSFEAKVMSEINSQAQQSASVDAMDTDGDGLTNTQELTIYRSSPFLPDSDGDGLSDKQEVDSNSDPNCPKDKQCDADGLVIGTEQLGAGSTSTIDLFNAKAANNTAVPANAATVQPLDQASINSLQQAFGANPDPAFLRAQLIQAAVKQEDKDALKTITDEQLLQMYNSMIKK